MTEDDKKKLTDEEMLELHNRKQEAADRNSKPTFLSVTLILAFCLPSQTSMAYGSGEIAEALAFSGCTFGAFPEKHFDMDGELASAMSLSLMYRIIDEGVSVASMESVDTPRGRRGYQHLLQSWATAGILSSKWKSLEPAYEKGMIAGLRKWNSGATLGVAKTAAGAVSGSKLIALCRVAEIAVTSKAKKAKMPLRQYIIKVSGQYLPPLP